MYGHLAAYNCHHFSPGGAKQMELKQKAGRNSGFRVPNAAGNQDKNGARGSLGKSPCSSKDPTLLKRSALAQADQTKGKKDATEETKRAPEDDDSKAAASPSTKKEGLTAIPQARKGYVCPADFPMIETGQPRGGKKKYYPPRGERRYKNNQFIAQNYKTEICRSHRQTGTCEYGKACQFAHGIHELRPRHYGLKYKTQECKNYHSEGYCRFGSRCKFIHDEHRIRVAKDEFWLVSPSENLVRVEVVENEDRQAELSKLVSTTTVPEEEDPLYEPAQIPFSEAQATSIGDPPAGPGPGSLPYYYDGTYNPYSPSTSGPANGVVYGASVNNAPAGYYMQSPYVASGGYTPYYGYSSFNPYGSQVTG